MIVAHLALVAVLQYDGKTERLWRGGRLERVAASTAKARPGTYCLYNNGLRIYVRGQTLRCPRVESRTTIVEKWDTR